MYPDNSFTLDFLLNAVVTTNTDSAILDRALYEGAALLGVSVRASGSGTLAIGVFHRADANDTYAAVPADALFNPDTGEPDTFDNVTTAASEQILALALDKCKRDVIVRLTAGTSHNVAIAAVAMKKYANFSQF